MKQKFFWSSLAFSYDPANVGNLISGSCAFSKSSLYIWKFSIHGLLKPSLMDFEQTLLYKKTLPYKQTLYSSLNIFGIALLWDKNEN